jgi:hypothetical protein
MTDELSEESKAMASRAAEIYGQIAAMVKEEHQNVVGAVLGSMLAVYLSCHDIGEQMEVLHRLLILAKNILDDLNAANGVHNMGDAQFQFVYEDGVREEMEKDPKIAEFVRDQTARVRQALADFQAGKYRSLDDAMQAAGLSQVDADDLEDLKDRITAARKPS